MKNAAYLKGLLASVMAVGLAVGVPTITAADTAAQKKAPGAYSYPRGAMGPGMMGGGYGMMGPGMMGGYGMGMGQGMMGGGMMMGPGMMGGYGMGPMWGIDLTDEQQGKINKIQEETRKKNWDLMGKMMDEQAKLRDLFLESKRDTAAITATHKRISDLRQQMFEMSLDAHNRMEAVLTKEQQEKLRSHMRRGGWMWDY